MSSKTPKHHLKAHPEYFIIPIVVIIFVIIIWISMPPKPKTENVANNQNNTEANICYDYALGAWYDENGQIANTDICYQPVEYAVFNSGSTLIVLNNKISSNHYTNQAKNAELKIENSKIIVTKQGEVIFVGSKN